eukprot:EG_transcript_2689
MSAYDGLRPPANPSIPPTPVAAEHSRAALYSQPFDVHRTPRHGRPSLVPSLPSLPLPRDHRLTTQSDSDSQCGLSSYGSVSAMQALRQEDDAPASDPPDRLEACGRCPDVVVDALRPHVGQILWPHLLPALSPLLLLVIALAVTFAVGNPSTEAVRYIAGYSVLAVAMWAGALVTMALQWRRMVLRLADEGAMVAGTVASGAFAACKSGRDVLLSFSADRSAAYLQAAVYRATIAAFGLVKEEEGPLDALLFVKPTLAQREGDTNGCVVTDLTGTILWVNAALAQFFHYEPAELISENIRLLMPDPFRKEHDGYLQRYVRGGRRIVAGHPRRVPVVDKVGGIHTVSIKVEEQADPNNDSNRLFLAQMLFQDPANHVDPATVLQQQLAGGASDVRACCAPLSTHSDNIVVLTEQGIIEFANDAAELTLGYDFGGLLGKNLFNLMAEDAAQLHNTVLARLARQGKGSDSSEALEAPVAPAAAALHSLDFSCRSKRGDMIRVFMTIKRIERPEGACLFLGTLLPVQDGRGQTSSRGSYSGVGRRQSTWSLVRAAASIRSIRPSPVLKLATRKCTLILVDLRLNDYTSLEAVQHDYHSMLALFSSLCLIHHGVLQSPVGDRVAITLNVTLVNAAHRACAGLILSQIPRAWPGGRGQLATASTSGACLAGMHNKTSVFLSDTFDIAAMLLRIGAEAQVRGAMVDCQLFEELQYGYDCRLINIVSCMSTSWHRAQTIRAYELCCAKEMEGDEWLYQLAQHERHNPLALWKECWAALGDDGASPGLVQPDYSLALDCLEQHLETTTADHTAVWLQDAIRQRQRSGRSHSSFDAVGRLQFLPELRGVFRPPTLAMGSSVNSLARSLSSLVRP